MSIFSKRFLGAIFLSCAMSCTVGDAGPYPGDNNPDAAVGETPDAGVEEVAWNNVSGSNPNLKPALHWVSPTEIYAIIGEKVCVWDGNEWKDVTLAATGLAGSSMHFVSTTEIYAVIGNKICKWDGVGWVPMTEDQPGINPLAGTTTAFHYVSPSEMYAVVDDGVVKKLCKWTGILGEGGAWGAVPGAENANLMFEMDYKSPTEIYVVIGEKICVWNGIQFGVIVGDQANLKPKIQVADANNIYAIIGDKVCKWESAAAAWKDLTGDMAGLSSFYYNGTDDIVGIAGEYVTRWYKPSN
jgi:hypothetical protein